MGTNTAPTTNRKLPRQTTLLSAAGSDIAREMSHIAQEMSDISEKPEKFGNSGNSGKTGHSGKSGKPLT